MSETTAEGVKRAKIAEKSYDVAAQHFLFSFANGETVEGKLSDFPPEILTHFTLHGILQKGGDAYSGEKDVVEAAAKCHEVLERAKAGEWQARREKGEGSVSLTCQAIAELESIDPQAVKAKWDGLDEELQKQIRKDPRVQAKMAEIKAARLAKKAAGSESSVLSAFQ